MSNDKLTKAQRGAIHVWFKETADVCLENGVCINDIIGKAIHMQVDEYFIKWLYRRVASKKKYIEKSTEELSGNQPGLVYEELVKFFAEQVDPPISLPPFPSQDTKSLAEYEKTIRQYHNIKDF